jgi:hypothetical protein
MLGKNWSHSANHQIAQEAGAQGHGGGSSGSMCKAMSKVEHQETPL